MESDRKLEYDIQSVFLIDHVVVHYVQHDQAIQECISDMTEPSRAERRRLYFIAFSYFTSNHVL